jgi:hypothetical protein
MRHKGIPADPVSLKPMSKFDVMPFGYLSSMLYLGNAIF